MSNLAEMNNLPSSPSTRPYSQWFEPVAGLGIAFIDHLFNRLDGAYPHKWRSNFANQQAIDNWAESWVEAFEEERITPTDVKVGLRECRKRFAWPPSCAEFIQACRPGLDPLSAYYEAIAGLDARGKGELGTWSHPAIYWAAASMRKDLQSSTHAQVKDRWDVALKGQMSKEAWADIPPARLMLPPAEITQAEKERAEQMLRKLHLKVTASPGADGRDPRAWAKRILERERTGDKTLMAIQVRFAREAMGAEA